MDREQPPTCTDRGGPIDGRLRLISNPTEDSDIEPHRSCPSSTTWTGVIEVNVHDPERVTQETIDRVTHAVRELGIGASAYYEDTVIQMMFDITGYNDEAFELLETVTAAIGAVDTESTITHAEIEYWDPAGVQVTRSPLGEVAIQLVPRLVIPD